MTSLEALVGLLEAEHAALWAYGLLGARLSGGARRRALADHQAHLRSRDALTSLVGARGADLPPPAATYDARADTPAAALRLAVRIEDGLALRWHDLLVATSEPGLRRLGVRGLTDCAVRAARWRSLAGARPLTQPFPGQT